MNTKEHDSEKLSKMPFNNHAFYNYQNWEIWLLNSACIDELLSFCTFPFLFSYFSP